MAENKSTIPSAYPGDKFVWKPGDVEVELSPEAKAYLKEKAIADAKANVKREGRQ